VALKQGLKAEKPEESGLSGALLDYASKDFYALKDAVLVNEKQHLEHAKAFLEKELNVEIRIESEEESSNEKASRAMPFKPALYFE